MSAYLVPQIKPDHDVEVLLVDGKHAVPDIPTTMRVGQTVRYSSLAGQVTMTFDQGSPFLDDSGQEMMEVPGSEILELKKDGEFLCKCSITLPNGQTIGWLTSKDPQSGGDHHVGH